MKKQLVDQINKYMALCRKIMGNLRMTPSPALTCENYAEHVNKVQRRIGNDDILNIVVVFEHTDLILNKIPACDFFNKKIDSLPGYNDKSKQRISEILCRIKELYKFLSVSVLPYKEDLKGEKWKELPLILQYILMDIEDFQEKEKETIRSNIYQIFEWFPKLRPHYGPCFSCFFGEGKKEKKRKKKEKKRMSKSLKGRLTRRRACHRACG